MAQILSAFFLYLLYLKPFKLDQQINADVTVLMLIKSVMYRLKTRRHS